MFHDPFKFVGLESDLGNIISILTLLTMGSTKTY